MGHFKSDIKKSYLILAKTSEPSFKARLIAWLWRFDLQCIAIYRFGQWSIKLLHKNKLLGCIPFLLFMLSNYFMRFFHHVEISNGTSIGPGFYIGHPSNIYIGPTTIGKNCSLAPNVIIGWGVGSQAAGIPTIGDNVWIGPGAIITGGIHIGNSVAISAGSVVNKSVPDRCLVAGNPARIVFVDYDNSELLKFKI